MFSLTNKCHTIKSYVKVQCHFGTHVLFQNEFCLGNKASFLVLFTLFVCLFVLILSLQNNMLQFIQYGDILKVR